jgi:ApbE superfamily uncharacterized protein (UPF0280 family)
MSEYTERAYRRRTRSKDLISYNVKVKETDLWISSDRDLELEAGDLVFDLRNKLETYIESHPKFLTTLQPYPEDPFAPEMIREMISITRNIGVGPMASVAGAIAQYVGEKLLSMTDQVIIENGGDIFLKVDRPVTIAIFAGESPLSDRIGVIAPTRLMPLGICSSSASVGHSLSMGATDVVSVISSSAILADGAATALGNRLHSSKDLDRITEIASGIDGILGGVVIMWDRMAAWGDVELTEL